MSGPMPGAATAQARWAAPSERCRRRRPIRRAGPNSESGFVDSTVSARTKDIPCWGLREEWVLPGCSTVTQGGHLERGIPLHRTCFVTNASFARALQTRLKNLSDTRTKAYWDRHLGGAVPFRGVPMERVRGALRLWIEELGVRDLARERQKQLAVGLIRERFGEDKIAGILLLHEQVNGHLTAADLPWMAELFDSGAIADWNTCDWFAVKVLQALLARHSQSPRAARAVAAWRRSGNVLRQRAACVALVSLARRGERAFPGLSRLALATCASVVKRPERSAQTAVGWLLRELSRTERPAVSAFVRRNARLLSDEAMRCAVEKLLRDERRELFALHAARRVPDLARA